MLESSKLVFQYLSPTWTRSPSGTRSPIGTRIALRCDPGSLGLSSHSTSYRNISLSNPSRSRNPSSTRSLTGIRSP